MLSRITMIFGAAFVAASFPVAVFANDGTRGLQAGGAIAVTPKFEGSKDYEIRGFPIVAPAGSGGAPDAQPAAGVGVPACTASGMTPAQTGMAMSSALSSGPQLRILAAASASGRRRMRVPASSAGLGGRTCAMRRVTGWR